MFNWVLNTPLGSSELFTCFYRRKFPRNKIGRITELIFASVVWNSAEKTIVFTKISQYIILNMKIKWLTFLTVCSYNVMYKFQGIHSVFPWMSGNPLLETLLGVSFQALTWLHARRLNKAGFYIVKFACFGSECV